MVTMEIKKALAHIIDECNAENILPDFFKVNKDMIISADAIDCTIERREQFKYEVGVKQGKIREIIASVREGDYSKERGAQKLGISVDEFEKLMDDPAYNQ